MAFETLRGEAGVDFIGTDNVDALFSLNETGAIMVDAKDGDDTITLSDTDNVVGTATVKGGAGDDTIILTSQVAGNDSRLAGSSVNGGQGDDTFELAGAVSSTIRGNEDDDDFELEANYTNSTVNGNSGEDSFVISAADFSLSNSKILGGSDNDGSMDFTDFAIVSAVDSTINGSKGNDNISIADVDLATNFTVFGGQGNDVITSTNDGDDDVIYSGDKGDDEIDTTGATADSTIMGGEDNDLVFAGGGDDTIDGGTGDDIVNSGGGDDTVTLGDGDDTYADDGGDDTITGGAGSDTYTFGAVAGENEYIIEGVSDSAAALSGDEVTFDVIGAGFTSANNTIDISAIAESLTGDADPDSVNVLGRGDAIAIAEADTFAEVRAEMAGGVLTASGTVAGQVEGRFISIAAGDLAGDYLVLSNTNTVLDSGDLMFQDQRPRY